MTFIGVLTIVGFLIVGLLMVYISTSKGSATIIKWYKTIDKEDQTKWNTAQLLFGKHYVMGVIILLVALFFILKYYFNQ